MLIVGTAGHIDHGKTTLIYALTGMDTDRLAEEKRRGISIDLGFAHMSSPNGEVVSFIDVPGHERFIKNMLAGVGGIGAVLLVVAADEGVKPQTREHFDICRLLQISTGLIALTKIDSATPNQVAATRSSVVAMVKDSFLKNAPVQEVSAQTGTGLAELKRELFKLALPRQQSIQLMRLNVDRSFAARGFGTIVTGTLLESRLQVGETVHLHAIGKTARVRGLQVHGRTVSVAHAGERTAVNLTGIDHSGIQRGEVLTHANDLSPTSLVDAAVEWLNNENAPVRREQYLLHVGTTEIPVFLKTVGPGRARIWLSKPSLILPGDRFILRWPSPAATVGGGTILDAFPPARLNRAKRDARLIKLAVASWPMRIEALVEESANGSRLPELVKRTGLPIEVLRKFIGESGRLLLIDAAQRVVTVAWMELARERLLRWLGEFHRKNPEASGAPISQARLNLETSVAAAVFLNFPAIRVSGDLVSLATHVPQANSENLKVLARIEQAFRQAGLQPATPTVILQQVGTDGVKGRPYLEALIKSRRLVRVSDEMVFHADAIIGVRNSLIARKGRRFSISEFKEWSQVSRKYAIPLLEYLDRQHVTRREGDTRVIL